MRCLSLLALPLLLAACATTEGYTKLVDTWTGASEASLIRAWGPPQRQYEVDGVKFLAFVRSREAYSSGSPGYLSTGKSGDLVTVLGTRGYTYTRSCETVFEVAHGKVTSWSWRGNDCRAAEK